MAMLFTPLLVYILLLVNESYGNACEGSNYPDIAVVKKIDWDTVDNKIDHCMPKCAPSSHYSPQHYSCINNKLLACYVDDDKHPTVYSVVADADISAYDSPMTQHLKIVIIPLLFSCQTKETELYVWHPSKDHDITLWFEIEHMFRNEPSMFYWDTIPWWWIINPLQIHDRLIGFTTKEERIIWEGGWEEIVIRPWCYVPDKDKQYIVIQKISDKQQSIITHFANLRGENDKERKSGLKFVSKIISNVVKNPEDKKYRELIINKLMERTTPLFIALLIDAGFEKGNNYLTLSKEKIDKLTAVGKMISKYYKVRYGLTEKQQKQREEFIGYIMMRKGNKAINIQLNADMPLQKAGWRGDNYNYYHGPGPWPMDQWVYETGSLPKMDPIVIDDKDISRQEKYDSVTKIMSIIDDVLQKKQSADYDLNKLKLKKPFLELLRQAGFRKTDDKTLHFELDQDHLEWLEGIKKYVDSPAKVKSIYNENNQLVIHYNRLIKEQQERMKKMQNQNIHLMDYEIMLLTISIFMFVTFCLLMGAFCGYIVGNNIDKTN